MNTAQPQIHHKTPAAVIAFSLYLASFMFYVFKSGGPQLSNILLVLILAGSVAGVTRVSRERRSATRMFVFFMISATLTVLANYVDRADPQAFMALAFFAFNIAVLGVTMHLRSSQPRFDELIRRTILGLLILQSAVLLASSSGRVREVGTFNNPNQLSYWALVMLSIYVLLHRRNKMQIADLVAIALTTYCVMLSLSKAGLVALGFLIALFLIQTLQDSMLRRAPLLVLSVLAVGFLASSFGAAGFLSEPVERAVDRVTSIGSSNDDNLEGRNYDRLWRFPSYLLIGAGEGATDRFADDNTTKVEIHSTPATMLFSYGIFGTVLFLAFLRRLIGHAPTLDLVYLVPLLLYGLTHQGLRFSMFWVFLGVLATNGLAKKSDAESSAAGSVEAGVATSVVGNQSGPSH